MIRLFKQHMIRKVQELDGLWSVMAEELGKTFQLPVPGCLEQHPELAAYRGKGTYTREIDCEQGGNVRLEFKGVSHTADVYFDDVKIAHHYNAYTPFSAVVPNVEKGVHRLRVEVDNTFSEASALHKPNDYYTYGGITRPVSMELVPDVYIERVHVTTYLQDGVWMARLEVALENLSGETKEVEVNSSLEGIAAGKRLVLDGHSHAVVVYEQRFEGVKPWTQENPQLYMLHTILSVNGIAVDDMTERVGFRVVEVRGTKLYLNDKPVFLKGFNRHEDYAEFGCAIPLQLMARDVDIMQELGANSVRTCHYPNDERFLDICDERGILVWEENHARGLVVEDMLNPNFERQCEDCIREMIENHYNHPSIVIWGILNECASESELIRPMYQKQYEQIRSMDKTRPTTSATCRHFKDICLDLPDIVSFNMYSGWYEECSVDERNRSEIEWIRKSGGENKPIIVSEVGAGAIYGYRDRTRCKWSEERQADVLKDNLEVYLNDEDITGVYIWQFADCRVTEEEWFAVRPKSHNNKGIVDEYRRPKLAYDVVKELFGKK